MVDQRNIPEKVKKEVGNHALTFGTSSATKKFSVKHPVGRPNLLHDNLMKKVKDIAIGTCHADVVINRRHVNIAKGVVRANNPDILKAFGGTVELTNRWARSVLSDLNWSKRKETTSKIEPSPQFLAEEKFTF